MKKQNLFVEKDRIIVRNENGLITCVVNEFDCASLDHKGLTVFHDTNTLCFENVVPGGEVLKNCKKMLVVNYTDKIYIVNIEKVSTIKHYETSDAAQRNAAVSEIQRHFRIPFNVVEDEDTVVFFFKHNQTRMFLQCIPSLVRAIVDHFTTVVTGKDFAKYSLPLAFVKNENKKRKEM